MHYNHKYKHFAIVLCKQYQTEYSNWDTVIPVGIRFIVKKRGPLFFTFKNWISKKKKVDLYFLSKVCVKIIMLGKMNNSSHIKLF